MVSLETQEMFRVAFETGAYTLILSTMDDGRVVEVNQSFEQMFGRPRAEIIGRYEHGLGLYVPAEDRLRLIADLKTNGRVIDRALQCRRSNGEVFAAMLSLGVATFNDEDHILWTIRDATSRQRTEAALRLSEERLRLQAKALEATINAVMITDAKGAIVWVNPAFTTITGYAFDETIGKNPRFLKSGRQSRDVYANLWNTITAGRSWSGELVNVRKDGSHYTGEVAIAPVRDQSGAIAHYVAVVNDITQRRSLEKQVYESQRLESIGLLASGIAHDLNNILAPITLSLGILREDYPAEHELVGLLERSAQRGAEIVRQVLTFARGMDSSRTPLRVNRLVKEISQLIAETLPRNITVSHNLSAGEDTVRADPTQIHQVLLNLVVNARDAMPNGGTLNITLTNEWLRAGSATLAVDGTPGDYLLIAVSDTGVGIPPEIIARIFEPFFTTKPHGQGTGLGLSTVHGIVRSHNGFIQVHSTVGSGTTFKVYLPLATRAEATADNASVMAPPSGKGRCVLVADDEATIRVITRDVLKRHGFRCLVAQGGEQAVDLFRAHQAEVALVLLDRMMPGQSGEVAARAIHTMAPAVPIILATGLLNHDEPSAQPLHLNDAGIVATLQKPFTSAQLLHIISEHIER